MYPQLLHLYGPFAINTFGLMIALGLIIFTILILKDPRTKTIISTEQLSNLLVFSIFGGIIGARLLFALGSPESITSIWDFFAIWHGGFSLLGAVIAPLIIVPLYTYFSGIRLLPLLDIVTTYAPILQSISRIGCFFAGCCYGKPTSLFFGVTYCQHPNLSLMHISTHPTQLYHAVALLAIFIFMYTVVRKKVRIPGHTTMIYLMLMSLERFIIDFFRADRTFIGTCRLLSLSQCIALGILIISGLGILVLKKRNK